MLTLVGATTRAGMLTNPLRDRFGIVQRLEFYSTAYWHRHADHWRNILIWKTRLAIRRCFSPNSVAASCLRVGSTTSSAGGTEKL